MRKVQISRVCCIGTLSNPPTPPMMDSTKPQTDTVQPIKVNCNPTATSNEQALTNIISAINNNADYKWEQDSAYKSKNEASIGITKDSANANYEVINFNAGTNCNVSSPTTDAAHTIVAIDHSHPAGKANSPSPGDIYHVLEGYAGNHNFMADFIIAADSSKFALMITDTTNVANFLASYPKDSVVAAPPNNDWDSTASTFGKTIRKRFDKVMSYFYARHYPLELIQAYANVFMLSEVFNYSSAKIYKQVNGQFKELNIQKQYDETGNFTGIKMTICP